MRFPLLPSREGNRTVRVKQDFLEYRASGHRAGKLVSDNYVFLPTGTARQAWDSVAMAIVSGTLVTEIQQYFYR